MSGGEGGGLAEGRRSTATPVPPPSPRPPRQLTDAPLHGQTRLEPVVYDLTMFHLVDDADQQLRAPASALGDSPPGSPPESPPESPLPARGRRGVPGRVYLAIGLAAALASVILAALTGLLPMNVPVRADSDRNQSATDAVAALVGAGANRTPTVTLYLPAPDPEGLRQLAAATGLTSEDRMRRLAALLPVEQARNEVADRLRTLGFTVTATSTWSVTATASPDQITAIFGSPREARPELDVGQPLPGLPAALRGLVALAVSSDERRPALRSLAVPRASAAPDVAAPTGAVAGAVASVPTDVGLTDDRVRSAYAAPEPPTQAELARAPRRPAVASLQLSGGDPADLVSYARAASLPDPMTGGRFTAIGVGRDPGYDPERDGDGDRQFALDTQALLAAAPGLAHRAYVAPNTAHGLLEALDRVRTDAPGSDTSAAAVVALSVSWGECEQRLARPFVDAVETQLTALAAAGVTVFAGSGDGGSDGCGDGGQSTVYPASSPSVIAVGGTTLLDPVGEVRETAWPGSGGGCSTLFGPPSWQRESPCDRGRAVPDLALVGDPATGFAVHDRRHWLPGSGSATPGWVELGGTGLATPLATGLFAVSGPGAVVDSAGTDATAQPVGWGDIHSRLATAPAQAFRDVTTGSNGSYQAHEAHDLVTGRGAPLWRTASPALAPPPAAEPSDIPAAGTSGSSATSATPPGALASDLAAAAGLGLDGGVWLVRGGSESFTPLPGPATSVPTLVVHRGRLLAIVGGNDRGLWIRDAAGVGWSPLGPAGTRCFGQAAVVTGDDLHVGCRGEDGALYVGTTGLPDADGVDAAPLPARIGSWSRLGGETDYAPAGAVVDGTVTWFVTGRDPAPQDNLYRRGTGGWERLPVRCAGPPGAGGGNDSGRTRAVTYVGCRAAAGGLTYATGRLDSFGGAGGQFTGAPGFAVDPDGGATVVVTGTDSALYQRPLNPTKPGEAGWAQVGGRFIDGVSTVALP